MNLSEEHGGATISSFESFNHRIGDFQNFLKVHGRYNKPCFICKNLISKIKINGRGTYFCSFCQK